MTSKRVYFIIIGLVGLLFIGILGGTYGVNSLLQAQSNKVIALKSQVAGLNDEQIELTKAKQSITTYTNLDNIAKAVVPQNKDQAEAVRQIVALAASSGVELDSIAFPTSSLGISATGVQSTATTAVVPTAAASASASALSQLTAVPNIPGVYVLVINVNSSTATGHLATYPEMIAFLSALEQNRQTALVSSLSITPNANNRSLFSFALTLDIYIKP
jgi:hypothetical protein